jgi:hypothetical protein
MRKAIYTVKIKDNSKSEDILNKIDIMFIELEKKHPELEVSI